MPVRPFASAALSLLLVGSLTAPGFAQSPAPSDPPPSSGAPPSTEVISGAIPSGFAWEVMTLPEGVNTDLPVAWFSNVPGVHTIVVAAQVDAATRTMGDAGIWTSSDLTTWVPAPVEAEPHLGPAVIGGTGATMVSRYPRCDRSCAPVIHTSTDGTSWSEVTLPKKLAEEMRAASQLTATPEGYLIAGQRLVTKERRKRTTFLYSPAIWTSVDGVSWAVSDIEKGSSNPSEALAAAAGPDGTIIAAGTGPSGEEALWRRDADGSWQEVALPESAEPIPMNVLRVGRAAGRWYLAHTVGGLHVWTSSDGIDWEPVVELDGPGMVLPFGDQVVQLAAAEQGGQVTLRLSADWEAWTEFPVPGLDGHNAYPVAITHDGRLIARTFQGDEPSVLWVATPIP